MTAESAMENSTNPVLHWFGHLQLAYKYIVVFLSILFITILAGFVKVLYNRRQLKKAKKAELEAGPSDDTVELNHREKDEGDLFGIRAIEAGFFAGVAQSRPTSRANSYMEQKSGSTTVAGSNSSHLKADSNTSSIHSLNLGGAPSSKLRPSEAEMSGRRNHNGAVDMSLHVPPSPGHPRGPPSPTFGGSDSDGEEFKTSRSPSPRLADFNPEHYTPASTIPMPDALQVSYHAGNNYLTKSQSASFNASPAHSPSPTPPLPGNPPASQLPTVPQNALRKDSRSPSPESHGPHVRVYHPSSEPSPFSAGPMQTQTHASAHRRDMSDASSIYSFSNRLSTYQAYHAYHQNADRSISPESTNEWGHTSVVLTVDKEAGRQSGHLSTFLAPSSQGKDSRLSDFYDAYYRNSHLGPSPATDSRRPVDRQSTIMEVDSPMPSPLFPKSNQPGSAF